MRRLAEAGLIEPREPPPQEQIPILPESIQQENEAGPSSDPISSPTNETTNETTN